MKLALFFLGVCLAQATLNPEDLKDKVYEQGKEYNYHYEGDVRSGIPQTSDKYSGMRIESDVRLQFKTDQDVLMRLENIKFKSLRGELESPEERELRRLTKDDSEEKIPEQRQRTAFHEEFYGSSEFERLSLDSEERLTQEERREERLRQQLKEKKNRKSSTEEESRSQYEPSRELSEEVDENDKLMKELRRQLEKPVLVRYVKGNVTEIQAQKDEPQESVNIKRGILMMIQVTMDPKNVETLDKDKKDKSQSNRAYDKSTEKLFRIMEQGVSGDCETQYDIRESRLQDKLTEVTKTKDFRNCRQRAEKLFSLVSAKKIEDERKERKEDKLESTSVTRMLVISDKLRSDKFLIQESEIRSQHVFQPYNKEGGEVVTFSKQTLKLKEAKQISERMPEPREPELKGNLSFVFQKDESERRDSQEDRRQETTEEKKEKIERLSKEISKEMKHSVSEKAPRKFIELVKELRQLNEQQMKEILKELITKPINQGEQRKQRLTTEKVEEKNQTRKVLLDAVSLVGKWEALRAVRELMELKRISESETEMLLTGLSLSIQPCPGTTREMLEIAKSSRAEESKQIRRAAWLSVGTMVNGMISKQKEGQMHKKRPQDQEKLEEIKREFSRELLKGVEEEKSEEEKLLFLRAIKNAGLEQTLDRLLEIISGKDSETNTKEVRVQAIDALSRIAKRLPNKVRQIALRVFQNPEKSESERIRAYEVMMKTKPTLSFIELIAQSTQRETSNQVGQYVYTDLKSRSESKLQQDKKMSKMCKIALRLAKPFNKGIQYSESRKWQMVDEELDMGVSLDLKSISNKKSILPKDVRAQLRLNTLGYDIKLLEIATRAEGLQTMIDSLFNKKQEEKKSIFDYMMKKTRETSEEYRKTKEQRSVADIEVEKIQSRLPIETRRDEEPRLTYSMKWSDNEVSFQEWNKEELKKLVREGKLPMSDLEEQLRKGLKHQITKSTFLFEASRQIPTTLGLPLHLNLTSVLVLKSKTESKLEVLPRLFREDRTNEKKEVRRIESELKSNQTIVLYTVGKMTVDSRVLKSGVAINVTLNTTLPVSGKLSMDLESQKYKWTMETPNQERELVTLKSRPFVYTEEKKIREDRERREREVTRRQEFLIKGKKIQKQPTEYNRTFGREEFGVEFRLNSSMVSRLNKEKRAPFQPLTGPVELRLSVKPGQNKPEKIEIEVEKKEVRVSSSERSEERREQQKKDQRWEINILAKHERQDREMKIKIQDSQEKVEEDPRRRQLDSREQRIPKKFLLRSIQEEEPFVSEETRELLKESQKEQTRRTIAVQIERKRLQNEREDFKACVNMEFEYPTYADYRLVQDRIQKAKIDAKWGRDCSGNDKKMQLTAKFQKSVEQRRQERREEQMFEQAPKDSQEWIRKETEQDFESFLESLSDVFTFGERSVSSRSSREQERRDQEQTEKKQEYYSESHSDKKREIRENVLRKCLQERRQGRQFPQSCLKAIEQRSQLRELEVEIEHQNLPTWMKQLFSDLHKHVQHQFWDRVSVKDVDVRNEINKLRLRLTVDKDFKEMNVTIKTPREEVNVTRVSLKEPKLKINLQKVLKTELPLKMDLSLPVPLRFPSTKYSLMQEYQNRLMNKQYWPYCKVEHDKIKTFDDVEYKYELSKCEHILAKDASPEERFMVLISKKEEQKPENILKVFLEGKKIELRTREQSREEERREREEEHKWTSEEEKEHKHNLIEITMDGREVEVRPEQQIVIRRDQNDRNSEKLFTIQRVGKMVKIISEKLGLKIKHDNHATWVKASNNFRSKMAGLCGNFDGEQTNEYSGPSEEIYRSHKMFALSYQVPSKQCEVEGKKLPKMRNVMISRTNENGKEETCFSKTPVPQCPEGSRKTKTEKSQMEFHCLYTNLESTKKMMKLHQTKPLEKMMSKKTDRVQEIEAELECREQ